MTGVDCLVMVVVQVGHYHRDRCGLFSDVGGSGRLVSQKQVWTVY